MALHLSYKQLILVIVSVFVITVSNICLSSDPDVCFADSSTKQTSSSAKSPLDRKTEYNRLVSESSPYLQQHVTNPIDWYPWSKEAFEAAKREDKPIFLSIGYSI
jgi:hypothetical protein